MTMRLFDSALFAVSQDLWYRNVDNVVVLSVNWRNRTSRVLSSVNNTYPNIPRSIQTQIRNCIKQIGDEIFQLMNYRHFNSLFAKCLNDLRFKQIIWTSNFTIDRVKTLLSLAEVETTVEGYTCPSWAKRFWESQGEMVKNRAFQYFGNYRFKVFFYWVCYLKPSVSRQVLDDSWTLILHHHSRHHYLLSEARERRHRFNDHLNYFKAHYEGNSPPENVFRFLVISGIIEDTPSFLISLTPIKRRNNVYFMTKLLITDYSNKHFRPSSHVLVNTLLFLWNNLEKRDQMSVIQDHFDDFFRFILSFSGTEVLVAALRWYIPSNENLRSHRRYLLDTITAMSRDRNFYNRYKQRLIFHILYDKFRFLLSEIDIINLIEKLLIIKDTESAIMIAAVLDNERKDILLDAVHKIWNDLWKDSVEKDVFLNFFFEVQSGLVNPNLIKV